MSVRSSVTSLLRRLAGPPAPAPVLRDDTTFGRIGYSQGHWCAHDFRLPSLSPHPVLVTIPGTAAGPSEDARHRFSDILAKLPELNAQVTRQLFDDYRWLREEPRIRRKGLPDVETPQEIWRLANVTAIWMVLPPGERAADFEVDYGTDWDDDHQFVALFENWQLVELRKDG